MEENGVHFLLSWGGRRLGIRVNPIEFSRGRAYAGGRTPRRPIPLLRGRAWRAPRLDIGLPASEARFTLFIQADEIRAKADPDELFGM
jgi:hypothetical protein